MSPAEKRYFKRHYASDQNIITELFDFINGISFYDEEAIKASFGSKVAKNLKVYKVQLYDLVLKSLVSYHQKKSINSKIRTGLEEVDVLIEKQLYDQAGDRLVKIKRLALKFEEFTYLIEITQKEFYLFHLQHDQIGISEHPIFTEIKKAIDHLENHLAFSRLGHQLMDSSRSRHSETLSASEKAYFGNLLQLDLLQLEPSQLPFRAQLSRNALLSFLYNLLKNRKKDFKMRKDNVELFQQFPHFKESMPFNYMGVLRNYLNFCGNEMLVEEVVHTMDKAIAFAEKHKEMDIHLIHFYCAKLDMYFKLGHFEYIVQHFEPRITKHIKKHKLKEERVLGLIYQVLIVTYLLYKEHVIVQKYFRKVEEIKPKLKDSVVAFLQILELISHFESGDEFLIERLISSWQRRKKSRTATLEMMPFYQDCLEFLKNLVKKPFERVSLAKAFLIYLSNHADKNDRVYQAFKHHSLDLWVKGIASRKDFAEEMGRNREALQKKGA